jgi:hypothetical protein
MVVFRKFDLSRRYFNPRAQKEFKDNHKYWMGKILEEGGRGLFQDVVSLLT